MPNAAHLSSRAGRVITGRVVIADPFLFFQGMMTIAASRVQVQGRDHPESIAVRYQMLWSCCLHKMSGK